MKFSRIALSAAFAAATVVQPASAETQAEASARSAAVRWAEAASAGDLASVWSALPSSWRENAAAAAKALGAKAKDNPATWNAARACLSEVAGTVAKKSGFAADLASRTFLPSAKAAVAEDGSAPALVRVAAKLGAALKAATPEALAGGDVASVLAAPALSMPGVTDSLPAASAPAALSSLAARENPDGSVTVGIPGGGASRAVKMVKKDGSWVPAPLAAVFAGSASWKDAVSSVSLDQNSSAAIQSALGMIRKSAAGASQAATQEQFDKQATAAAFPFALLSSAFSAGGASSGASSGAADAVNLLKGFLR